ncbi:MAG: hypothetical protein V4466_18460 [Pseudomonadota bacterium]
MRFTGIGVAAALVVAVMAPAAVMAAKKPAAAAGAVDAKAREKGMADAPALVTASGAACTVADARFIGADTKSGQSFYEVACTPGIGGVLMVKKDDPKPAFFTCLETSKPGPDGKPNSLACVLPANADPVQALAPLVAKSGVACTIDKARSIGASATNAFFEVSCQGGAGYILQTSAPVDPSKDVKANTCLAYEPGGNLSCQLSDRAAQLTVVDTLAAGAGKNCTVKDKRFVLATTSGSTWYEVSCQDGKGYMLEQSGDGKLARAVDCAQAAFVGGGCTFTDTQAAQTEQNVLYTSLASKGGFPCKVEKYGILPSQRASQEVVELKCSDRPDGVIAIFDGANNSFLNCAVSEAQGYRCAFTKKGPTEFAKVTADLKSLGKGECIVSDTRAMEKRTEDTSFLEVACSDGLPGWVIGYTRGTAKPKETLSCLQGESLGGCKLPTNIRKKS